MKRFAKKGLPGVGFEPTSPVYHAGASRPARVRVTTGGLALQRLQVADSFEIQPNRAFCRVVQSSSLIFKFNLMQEN